MDIKLENILVDDDKSPLIADFDISKDVSGNGQSASLTLTTTRIGGTFEYMAPELRQGGFVVRSTTSGSDSTRKGIISKEMLSI